jgi:glycosyltransferase involved in cell wall biosynthesis
VTPVPTTPANAPAPVCSVCVPTYNRASSLDNLFRSLEVLKDRHGDAMEICVSNNNSSDGTAEVIQKWQHRLNLKVAHQSRNVGGTLNMVSVVQMATGRWGVLVGDDDELLPEGFAALLTRLEATAAEDWLLTGVANPQGKEHLLVSLPEGQHTAAAFRRVLLRHSLLPLGFMGVHVFPQAAKASFAALTLQQAQPWPHIAAFLRTMDRGQVHVFKTPVMIQAQGGAQLFWSATDLAKITLSKLRILGELNRDRRDRWGFHSLLMLRELYSWPNFILLVAWRLYEPGSYQSEAVVAYAKAYRYLGPLVLCGAPHLALVLALKITPHILLRLAMKAIGKAHFLPRYEARKLDLQAFDGIKRGI